MNLLLHLLEEIECGRIDPEDTFGVNFVSLTNDVSATIAREAEGLRLRHRSRG